jgi:ABC-2 type transport system permease protein
VELALHALQPSLEGSWFGALMEVVNNVTMLVHHPDRRGTDPRAQHGTVEHLLVMPGPHRDHAVQGGPWAGGGLASTLSLNLVIQGALKVPIEGRCSSAPCCTCSPPLDGHLATWRAACRSSACC